MTHCDVFALFLSLSPSLLSDHLRCRLHFSQKWNERERQRCLTFSLHFFEQAHEHTYKATRYPLLPINETSSETYIVGREEKRDKGREWVSEMFWLRNTTWLETNLYAALRTLLALTFSFSLCWVAITLSSKLLNRKLSSFTLFFLSLFYTRSIRMCVCILSLFNYHYFNRQKLQHTLEEVVLRTYTLYRTCRELSCRSFVFLFFVISWNFIPTVVTLCSI